ncbi:FAD-binding oxidoreductase [Serratia sp. NPDC078593]|uniref:FAD-binding oxidoreductase n=1 Tax=unclassified Serratia (in: enterobacteria) TaxID=2647522 RepID=UPI0037CF155B
MTLLTTSRRRFIQMASAVALTATGLLRTGFAKAHTAARTIPELTAFKGTIITRNDPLYMDWFWGMSWYKHKPQRFPWLIVQPIDEDDVRLAIEYANKANLRITMRSSGHNITASPLRAGAMTIDMSKFHEISINPEEKTVWAGPGVFSERLNEALSQHNLAFPSAHTGFVSLGGYLLGGGMGWNMPSWGMASNSILELEAILADGSKVIASERQNPDLYWAARGAGPAFFAIILRYKLRVYDSPKVIQNIYYVPVEKVEDGVEEMLRLAPQSQNRTEILGSLGLFSPPGTPDAEKKWHWVLMLYSYAATEAKAREAASLFTESPFLKEEAFQFSRNKPLSYQQLYAQLGSTDAYSILRTTELAFFTENPGRCLRTTIDTLNTKACNPLSFGFSVIACNPIVDEPACYTYGAPHYISWYLVSETPEEVKKNEQLALELHAALKPDINTYYMNEVDFNLFPDAARLGFSPPKWEKLQQVRHQYDPNHRFVSYVGVDPIDQPASATAV